MLEYFRVLMRLTEAIVATEIVFGMDMNRSMKVENYWVGLDGNTHQYR